MVSNNVKGKKVEFGGTYNETGKIVLTSPKIEGFLEYIMIDSSKHINNVEIYSEDCPELKMFTAREIPIGKRFLPVRYQGVNNEGERINFSENKFLLGSKIIIEAAVSEGTTVEVVMIYG